MTHRRRDPRGGARGAAALLLSGVALLGTGAGIALGDDPRIVAADLGAVPAAGGTRSAPASAVLPVLAPPDAPAVAPGDAPAVAPGDAPAVAPGDAPGDLPAPADAPAGPPAVAPGAAGPPAVAPGAPGTVALPGPGVPAAETPRPAGPAPIAPREAWTVSAIFPPSGPRPAAPRTPVVPATLELPARGITAPVDAVGTGPNGGMVVPEQVRTVGWWAPGVLPGGAAGSAVIAGHVDSRTQGVGVLAVLPQLTAGERVVVRGTDGRPAAYRVAARREYGKYDLPREVFRRDGDPQLVLITCGGVFDPVAGSYESNIVVYAVPEPL